MKQIQTHDLTPVSAGWFGETVKAIVTAAFMVEPVHLFSVVGLFILEIVMGKAAAKRKGRTVGWREYMRESAWKVVNLGAVLAVILLITNMTPALESVKTWAMVATAVVLGGKIMTNHVSEDWQDWWLRFKDRVFAADTRSARGRPDPTPVDAGEEEK